MGFWKNLTMYGSLYEGVEASVLLGGEYSRWFEAEAGLRQGGPLLPVLYSVYVIEMLKDEKRLGIEVEGTWCGGLLYADNIVLLARDQEELRVMLDVVGKYVMKWRFRINSRKITTKMVGGKCRGGKSELTRRERGSIHVSWSVV